VTKILVTGTPSTGKSSFALKLSLFFYFNYFNINTLAYYFHSYKYYDKKRNSQVLDLNKLNYLISKLIHLVPDIIFDSHILDCFTEQLDYVIILRYDPLKLVHRLKLKGYSERKIKENVEAEFLGVISNECFLKFKKSKILEIDVSQSNKIFPDIIKTIKANANFKKYKKINWLRIYETNNRLTEFINFQLSASK
jgi:adenylate kinase